MDRTLLEELYKPFALKERDGLGGMKFKYIPSDDIIDRMNKVFEGNWSTEVVSQDIVEEEVLLRVSVRVFSDGQWISHDGYGSSGFKRFKSGPNANQVINVGNAYKAAESMAIRNACSRFGCGLYLEGDPGFDGEELEAQPRSYSTETPSMPKSPSMPIPGMNKPPVPLASSPLPIKTPVPLPKREEAPLREETPLREEPSLPKMPSLPKLSGLQSEQPRYSNSETGDIPPKTLQSVPPILKTKESAPEPMSQDSQVEKIYNQSRGTGVTNVQEAALDALFEFKKLNYEELVDAALKDAGYDVSGGIPERDQLNNELATVIIKYGNGVARRNS